MQVISWCRRLSGAADPSESRRLVVACRNRQFPRSAAISMWHQGVSPLSLPLPTASRSSQRLCNETPRRLQELNEVRKRYACSRSLTVRLRVGGEATSWCRQLVRNRASEDHLTLPPTQMRI